MADAAPTPEQVEAVRPTLTRIIDSVLRPDELERWEVAWTSVETPASFVAPVWAEGLGWFASEVRIDVDGVDTAPRPRHDELWLTVHARGEEFACPLWVPDGWRWGDLANVVNGIEDFVAESRFAWGQQRTAWRPGDAT